MFRHTAERGPLDWPIFEAYNLGKKLIKTVTVCAYAYYKEGNQVKRTSGAHTVYGINLPPGGKATITYFAQDPFDDVLPAEASIYEVCLVALEREGDGGAVRDEGRCPTERPMSRKVPSP